MRYQVPKRTNTYAEVIETVGLASLLEELTASDVRILEQGDHFIIEAQELPPMEQWPVVEPGYPFIYLKKDGNIPKGWVLDYDREKQKAELLRAFRNAAAKKRDKMLQTLREQGLEEPPSPVPEYQMALFLEMMRKGWASDKQTFLWLQEDSSRAVSWIKANLENSIEIKESPPISNSQVFNPVSGKGVHRPKPDSTTPGSIAGEMINPFSEWLKYRGAYLAMLPYRVDKDF
ncbi:MAG TPA: hypothetical protein PLZ49_08280, partial [Bacillota bacterium]|nr:hypothetical protein [Bacillota bacterium]